MKSKRESSRQIAEGKGQKADDNQSYLGTDTEIIKKLTNILHNFQLPVSNAIRMVAIFCTTMLTSFYSIAQGGSDTIMKRPPAEMATTMRSNGKIYVVVTVLIIILSGLFFYLIRLDKKITRLEKGNWKE